jgi:hypothetical protein
MEYEPNINGFIAQQVAPLFKTQKQKSTYPRITRESMTQNVKSARAAKSGYQRVNLFSEEGSYACEEHGLEGLLDDSERALYASDFDAELVTTKGVNNLLLLQQEIRIKNLIYDTATFTGADLFKDWSGSAPWDADASDVIAHVKNARQKVRANTGIDANALIIGAATLDNLTLNTGIKDAIKYVKELTEQELKAALARILGVDQIITGKSIYNGSKKLDTFSATDVWPDDYAMIARVVTDAEDFTQPGIARQFLWVADSPENLTVEQYRAEEGRSDVFRVRQNIDEVLMDKYFGFLMKIDV